MCPRFLLTALLTLTASISAFPQMDQDTAFLQTAIENTISLYRKGIGAHARLYNGSIYVAPEHTFEQHPYYLSIDWLTGDIFYDGELFQNVPLMLDLNSGQIITEHYSNGQPLRLVREKVGYFTISGHYFQRIDNETVSGSLPASGFYEIIYGGRTRVIVRRQKLVHEEIENTVIERTFDERNHFYLFKDGIFHAVKSRRSVLNLLQDQKQQLRKLLRQKKAAFRDNRELLYKSMAEYYDTLTKLK